MRKVYFLILLTFQFFVLLLLYSMLMYDRDDLKCQHLNSSSFAHQTRLRWELEDRLQKALSEFPLAAIPTADDIGKWVLVAKDCYVYSAYISDCPGLPKSQCVKFIAITVNGAAESNKFPVKCILRDESNSVREVVLAILDRINESHEQKFTAAFFYCPLPNDNRTAALTHASLFIGSTPSFPSWISIASNKSQTLSKDRYLNVCVRPFFGSILNIDLGEFIAYYSMMGVDHFTFYKANVSETMDVFLNIIKHLGVSLELHPWDMPLNDSMIHSYGQLAFIQDCISRSKLFATHVLIVDLDEFIAPKRHRDLKALVSHLDADFPNAGSFVVPNAFFCNEFGGNNDSFSPFRILFQNKRQETPWQHHYRSKLIVRPDRVDKVGIHFTWKHEKNMKEVFIPSILALLHHYRNCGCATQQYFFLMLSFYVVEDNIVTDNSVTGLQNMFLQNSIIKFIQEPSDLWSAELGKLS